MLEDKSYARYLEAGCFGFIRGAGGLWLEHPLDLIKTRLQASLKAKSISQVCQEIFQEKGLRGFYTGLLPNGTRLIAKHTQRYLLMDAVPVFYKGYTSLDFRTKHPNAEILVETLFIGGCETLIYCPLERCKVFLMTSGSQKNSLRQFIRLCGNQYSELFRGMQAVFARQVLNWGSFLYINKKGNEWERKRLNTDELPFSSILGVSVIAGIINTATMPLDVAKTSLQKYSPTSENLGRTIVKIYKNYGLQGLYIGWQVRMLQYAVHSAFAGVFINQQNKK